MKEHNENLTNETGNLYALTMALMNLLIVFIIGGVIWMIYQAVNNSTLYSLANGKFLTQ